MKGYNNQKSTVLCTFKLQILTSRLKRYNDYAMGRKVKEVDIVNLVLRCWVQ